MKKDLNKKIILTLLVLSFFVFNFPVAHAQQNAYVPLAPLPGNVPNGSAPENYIPQIFKLSIAIAGALAVIMIMLGGIKYITSASMGGKEDGKEMITNAIMGLLLAIGAYIILYSINDRLLSFNLSTITAPGTVVVPPPPPPPAGTCAITSACNVNSCYSQCPAGSAWRSDVNERTQLTSAGINFNNTNCTTVGQTGCTTVFLLAQGAINNLTNLKDLCPACNITITGGTEFWLHQTHGPMLPRVDLRYTANDDLDTYIRTNGTMAASCVTGSPAWSLYGHIYVLESNNHWHICD